MVFKSVRSILRSVPVFIILTIGNPVLASSQRSTPGTCRKLFTEFTLNDQRVSDSVRKAPSLLRYAKKWSRENKDNLSSLTTDITAKLFGLTVFELHHSHCWQASLVLAEVLSRGIPGASIRIVTTRESIGVEEYLHTFLVMTDLRTGEQLIIDPTIRQFFTPFLVNTDPLNYAYNYQELIKHEFSNLGIPEIFWGTGRELRQLYISHYNGNLNKSFNHPDPRPEKNVIENWVISYLNAQSHETVAGKYGHTTEYISVLREKIQQELTRANPEWLQSRDH